MTLLFCEGLTSCEAMVADESCTYAIFLVSNVRGVNAFDLLASQ